MRLRTIGLVVTLALGLLVAALSAEAQQTGKVYRIGILQAGAPSSYVSQDEVVRKALRELGYMEGKNLLIEYRYAESKLKRLPDLAAELVRLKVDVIVTSGAPPAIHAAQQATRTIPIVMMGAVVDPVEAGFVESLRRPGGNITGLTNLNTVLHGKRLGLLKEAFPSISRVAIIWTPTQEKQALKEVEATAKALGIQILFLVIDNRVGLPSLEGAFTTVSQERPDGLLVGMMRTTIRHRPRVIDFTAKKRLPTIYARSHFVDAGGLMSYNAVSLEIYRRVATYVDKILRGANPADLPIEQPTKFELIINLKTAKALNLTIPPTVLYRATRVIK